MGVGAYAKSVPDARTQVDWLSRNEDNVERYLADEACGFMFTCGGYAALMDLTARLADGTWAQLVDRKLPILFVAGTEDPVGDMGKGVQIACGHTLAANMPNTRLKLYEGMRHEILNEDDREQVYADIIAWLEEWSPTSHA